MAFIERVQRGWNAFINNKDPTGNIFSDTGPGYSTRPDRIRLTRGNERSIVTSVFNRIALDVAAVSIQHVRLDQNGRYLEEIDSGLNNCLTLEANIDQTNRSFLQDIALSVMDEGCIAIVPIDTSIDPSKTSGFDILTMRVGKIIEWYPKKVKVRVYDDNAGIKKEITISKRMVAIIENPLYAVMNESNSTMQRLIRKLNLLDIIDDQSSSGKLDLIIQLPYVIKSDARRRQAEERRRDIERQLSGSKYGIAYTDGTEKITQLNRAVENNLLSQIEYLTSMLYSQLGITQSILDGTADEKTMLNYYNRTIEPFVSAIVDEMKRKFLTKTARTQNQSILFFRDPFKLVPVSDLAEISDKLTRNEIASSNEIRQIIGWKPSSDPKADELRNKNLNQTAEAEQTSSGESPIIPNLESETKKNTDYLKSISDLDQMDYQLDELESMLTHGDTLAHYASPYYDPQKAHEYYMKNRELKSRSSTAKLNDEGKNAAKYVKEQLTTERKQKVQSHKDTTNSQIDTLSDQKKSNIESNKAVMQGEIDSLRTMLQSMSKEDKAQNKERIYTQIASLREKNKMARQRLQADFRASRTSLRDTHSEEKQRLKNEYDERYLQELDKIRADSKFRKKK